MLDARRAQPAARLASKRVRPANPYVHFAREEIEQSIAARFAQQVQKAPESIAVQTPSSRWTYKELDERSDNIAQEICAAAAKDQHSRFTLGA